MTYLKKIIPFFLLFILVESTLAQYYIHPYEEVYEDLRYLQALGLLQELNLNQKPILDSELICSIEKLSDQEFFLLSKIHNSYLYHYILQAAGNKYQQHYQNYAP